MATGTIGVNLNSTIEVVSAPEAPFLQAEIADISATDHVAPTGKAWRAFYVGGAGHVRVTTATGQDVLISNCLAGHIYRIAAKQITRTNSTATLIVALA